MKLVLRELLGVYRRLKTNWTYRRTCSQPRLNYPVKTVAVGMSYRELNVGRIITGDLPHIVFDWGESQQQLAEDATRLVERYNAGEMTYEELKSDPVYIELREEEQRAVGVQSKEVIIGIPHTHGTGEDSSLPRIGIKTLSSV